jgi:hypothetical protein
MPGKNFDEFMALYNPAGTHPVTEVDAPVNAERDTSPFIVVRSGPYTVIVNPLPQPGPDGYLNIDLHSFINGERVTASVLGMTTGRRHDGFTGTGFTSAGAPSVSTVIVLVGEQAEVPFTCSGRAGCRAPDGDEHHTHYCPRHSLNASPPVSISAGTAQTEAKIAALRAGCAELGGARPLTELRKAPDPGEQLARQAAGALTAAGWHEYDATRPVLNARFAVTLGDGAVVSLLWEATPERREAALIRMLSDLTKAGLAAWLRTDTVRLPLPGAQGTP